MCGIVGYVGSKQIGTRLIEGLKRLEYRGYDSSGLSIIENKQLQHTKRVGRVKTLEASLPENYLKARTGICHTRWATHGDVTEKNAHPHVSGSRLAVVHNGIIENYVELRAKLIQEGYVFESDTDTEVIVHLITENLKTSESRLLTKLGEIYSILDELDLAMNYFNQAESICMATEVNKKNQLGSILENKAEVYYRLKNFKLAIDYSKKG